ncbi:MAG: TonB-dependent receptor [Myxococcales bacterium]|nr:TonB-dependent receptor [Myxococcales bacterium]
MEVEEIVITGASENATGPSVTVVAREEILRLGARTLSDVLAVQPALQSVTGGRGERTLVLRGSDQRQTLLLVDSTPFFIPYDGQVDLNMIPAEMIDHVTVVKGAGSVLFGPTGLGGAINVVTRRPRARPSLQVTLEADGEGGTDLRGASSFRAGPVGVLLGAAWLRSPGFRLSSSFSPTFMEDGGLRSNSDREQASAFANLRLSLSPDQHFCLGGFFLSAEKGVPPSTLSSQARFWRFTEWRAGGVSAGYDARFDFGLKTDLVFFARWFDNLIDSYDDDRYQTQENPSRAFHSWYHDRMFGGRLRARYRIQSAPWGETVLRLWSGAQLDSHFEDWASGHFLDIRRGLLTVSPEAETFLGRSVTLTVSVQAELELPGNMPQEKNGTTFEANPLFSLGYEPRPGLSLLATVARRSRFPTLKERFSSSLGMTQPNPDLGPENAWHFGLDASWEASRHLQIQAAVYDAEVTGLIGRTPIGNGLEQMQNLGRSRLLGAETGLSARPWRWLNVSAGYAFLFARRTDLDPPENRLADRPEHKLTIEFVVKPMPRLELSTLLQLAGPIPFQHPDTMRWGELGVCAQWNARIAYHLDRWSSLWLRASNILDANYQTKFGFPEPGLQVFLGVTSGLSWAPPEDRR